MGNIRCACMHIQKPLLSSWPFPTIVTTVEEIAGLHHGTGWWLSSLDICLSGLEPQGLWQDQWWSSTTQVGLRDGGETGGVCLTDLPRSPHTFRHRFLEFFFFTWRLGIYIYICIKNIYRIRFFFKFRAALCKSSGVGKPWKGVSHQTKVIVDFLQLEQKNRRHRELLGESVMIFLIRRPQSEVEKSSYYGANNSKWRCLWKIPGSHKWVVFSIPTMNWEFNNFEPQPYITYASLSHNSLFVSRNRCQIRSGGSCSTWDATHPQHVVEFVDGWNFLGQTNGNALPGNKAFLMGFWAAIIPQLSLNKVLLLQKLTWPLKDDDWRKELFCPLKKMVPFQQTMPC